MAGSGMLIRRPVYPASDRGAAVNHAYDPANIIRDVIGCSTIILASSEAARSELHDATEYLVADGVHVCVAEALAALLVHQEISGGGFEAARF